MRTADWRRRYSSVLLEQMAARSASLRAVGDWLRDDTNIGDPRLPQGIDHGGKGSEGNRLIAPQIDRILRLFQRGVNLVPQVVDVYRIVAEVDALRLVYSDHQVLLVNLVHRLGFRYVHLDPRLQD